MSATKGVLYFNRGTRCLVRLLVSLHSLRRHYGGPVAIAVEGDLPGWFKAAVSRFNVQFVSVPPSKDYHLVVKAGIYRYSPFDHTMFLDADTLVLGPVDEFLEWVEKHGCVVAKFNNWKTFGRRIRGRINEWRKVDESLSAKTKDYRWAINTGVFGWSNGAAIMPKYHELSARGLKQGCSRKTLDEIAMQLLITEHPHKLAPQEWNCSGVYGDLSKARVMHYHGHKHCRDSEACQLWKDEYKAVVAAFPQFKSELTRKTGDASLELWLAEQAGYRKDITIVTAVNPEYAEKYRANFDKWMCTPGLKEQKFLVFVNGFKNASDRQFVEHPNVKVIRWRYPFNDATKRETMLAAFVLGVAEHVKTPYWMKLDADSYPIVPEWKWPDFQEYTVTSHKWGYSKIKGEPDGVEHWFNRLDRVFSPKKPFFKRTFEPNERKISHRPGNRDGIPMRYASFCHIEKTEFTQRIAAVVKEKCEGRLPIPSQDTLSWYCATLWNEPVKLMNMKEWFSPR